MCLSIAVNGNSLFIGYEYIRVQLCRYRVIGSFLSPPPPNAEAMLSLTSFDETVVDVVVQSIYCSRECQKS